MMRVWLMRHNPLRRGPWGYRLTLMAVLAVFMVGERYPGFRPLTAAAILLMSYWHHLNIWPRHHR